jgi:hypothetical protein
VTLEFGEGPRALPLGAAKDLRHRDLRVVVEDARGHTAKVREGSYVAFKKRFRRLGGKRHDKTVVGMR